MNNNTGWNTGSLIVTNTTTGSPVTFTVDATTGSIRFTIVPSNDYALGSGSWQNALDFELVKKPGNGLDSSFGRLNLYRSRSYKTMRCE